MMRLLPLWMMAALSSLALFLATQTQALACACCSNRAARYVEVEKLSPQRMDVVDRMVFGKSADVLVSEADDDRSIIDGKSTSFDLAFTRRPDRMIFILRDQQGDAGTLTLKFPKTISIFEVDPRGDEKDEGLGPNLYKEWKLTGDVSGTGAFRRAAGKGQKLTLIFHGRGRACTEADHFTDWTLLLHGSIGKATLYGALLSGRR